MANAAHAPEIDSAPHLPRLLARLTELAGAVIQIWGWPGTGKRALLEVLVANPPQTGGASAGPGTARPLALAEVETEERLRATLADPEVAAARWLVCLQAPETVLAAACRLLRPGQRWVGASNRRLESEDSSLPISVLGPAELLLTEDETRALVGSSGIHDEALARSLHHLTSGWYTPLRLVAGALAAGDLESPADLDVSALAKLPAIESFLRHEVLEPLPPEARSALLALARGGTGEPEALEPYGWSPRVLGGAAIPPLLGALARDRVHDRAPGVRSPGPRVRVALLGPPRVSIVPEPPDDREREIHWPLKRALKIFAYLASQEDLQTTRDDLAAALWPEADEDTVFRNFHPTLSHLRRTFRESWEEACGTPAPPPLLFLHDSYRLNPEIAWEVDTVELLQAGEESRHLLEQDPQAAVERWQAVAALYRGPFLSGFYDAWTDMPRERYQRRWLDLLRELADLYVRLDRLTDAVDTYRRVLIEDSLREPVHQALMRVYARQGRRDLVRRQYDRLTTLLAEELGVEPLPQTTEEYHRLMG